MEGFLVAEELWEWDSVEVFKQTLDDWCDVSRS